MSGESGSGFGAEHWPVELKLRRAERRLEVEFDDGTIFAYPAEFLRVESPSAEVTNHGGEKTILGGKGHVGITAVEPVGRYAVRIVFDDGHDTGIYSWSYLYDIGRRQAELWVKYLEALHQRGLSRL